MSFCVDGEAKAIKASATWGQYKRETRDDQQDYNGNPLKVLKRYPRGGSVTIPMEDGPLRPQAPDPEFPDVYIQGQVRRRNSHFIVTLFLVNAQEEQRPKDECHIFQPKLTVTGEHGEAVFCKRSTIANNDDLEDRLMAMMYRHQVEFAVDATDATSDAEQEEDSDKTVVNVTPETQYLGVRVILFDPQAREPAKFQPVLVAGLIGSLQRPAKSAKRKSGEAQSVTNFTLRRAAIKQLVKQLTADAKNGQPIKARAYGGAVHATLVQAVVIPLAEIATEDKVNQLVDQVTAWVGD